MSLSAEELQKTLTESMMSMQNMLDSERKEHKEKIKKLEKIIEELKDEIEEYKEKLDQNKPKKDEKQEIIDNLKKDMEVLENEISIKLKEYETASHTISELKDEIKTKDEKISQLIAENKEKDNKIKEIQEENDNKIKEIQKEKDNIANGSFLIQKELENHKGEKEKLEDQIKTKNNEISEIKEKLQKAEKTNNELLEYVKQVKETNENLKKEEQRLKLLEEKQSQELLRKKEEEKKSEIEKLMKENQKKSILLEGKEKFITDILCDFLLKLNNSQYFISVFDLFSACLKHYDELNFFGKLADASDNSEINDILFSFYGLVKSYFNIAGDNATLKDFLSQKSFKFSNIGKEDIEIIKRISSLQISKEVNILELYKKKKELYFKSVSITFDLLKDRIKEENKKYEEKIPKEEKKEKKNEEETCDFLKITKPPLELEVNFDELMKQNFALINYQVFNVFPKLKELTIHMSKSYLFVLYSIVVNCQNLNSLKIFLTKHDNETSIDTLNDIIPKILSYLKKLTEFGLNGVTLKHNKLSTIIDALKFSRLKKLTLNNCFTNKDDLFFLNSYFSNCNTLNEINLSDNNFHVPTLLNNTILNYDICKQLTSINFNNCQLNDDDIKYISNYIVNSSSILICDIGKNILSQLSCSTFGYCILKTTSLETLRINECGINGETLLFLFNGKGSKPLKHINLNGNEIGDLGLFSISAFLKTSPVLESIELKKCGGTDMGFISLVNTIHSNSNNKMKYINFQDNNLTAASVQMLKKYEDDFRSKGVIFTLSKFEGVEDDVDCLMFS